MGIFDRYVFKNLSVATLFVSLVLAVIVLLTQSLRFLELVIESGASSGAFWVLTMLALPRFFEVILPLSLMASIIFIYNRMTMDSEMVVVRAVGYSPIALARPALVLAGLTTIFLWGVTMWAAPKSLSSMNEMRQIIKAQFSSLLFREGVFNQIGSGLTVYMRERSPDGELLGLMIHDSRETSKNPSTTMAQRGVIVANDAEHQVVVYDGARQEFDPESGTLHRLNFERYTIDLPESSPVRQRWSEPDERTLPELLNPDATNARDMESLRDFRIELHRRIVSPLLAPAFTLIACCALLLGSIDRRGQGRKIAVAIGSVVTIQGLFLAAFNLARQTDWGLPLVYLLVIVPIVFCILMLSGMGAPLQRLFTPARRAAS